MAVGCVRRRCRGATGPAVDGVLVSLLCVFPFAQLPPTPPWHFLLSHCFAPWFCVCVCVCVCVSSAALRGLRDLSSPTRD